MSSNNPEEKKPNPFENLAELALPQDYASVPATIEFSYIPCRKPAKQAFVRVSPNQKHRGNFALLELDAGIGVEREQFLVMPDLMPALVDVPGLSARMLLLAVSRPENSPFLWPLRLPNNNLGRTDGWALSAIDIARQAETRWLRITANMQMGSYIATVATADWPEPIWPDLSFEQLLERSFGGSVITDLAHPAIRSIRGEA